MPDSNRTMDEIRDDVIHRICRLVDARSGLITAAAGYEDALAHIDAAWDKWDDFHRKSKCEAIQAATVVNKLVLFQVENDLLAAASQAGFLIARDVIAPVAQQSDEAVVALTGNSYMPPIRDIEDVEVIWSCDEVGDVFTTMIERLEEALDDLGIIMGSPDYDNMLYVVDSRRWKIKDEYPLDDDVAWLDNSTYEPIE